MARDKEWNSLTSALTESALSFFLNVTFLIANVIIKHWIRSTHGIVNIVHIPAPPRQSHLMSPPPEQSIVDNYEDVAATVAAKLMTVNQALHAAPSNIALQREQKVILMELAMSTRLFYLGQGNMSGTASMQRQAELLLEDIEDLDVIAQHRNG